MARREKKIYSATQVLMGSLFFGMVASVWFLRYNYRTLGDKRSGGRVVWAGVFCLLLSIVGGGIWGEAAAVAITFLWMVLAGVLAHKHQYDRIMAYIADGGGKRSGWSVVLVGLIFVVLQTAAWLALMYV